MKQSFFAILLMDESGGENNFISIASYSPFVFLTLQLQVMLDSHARQLANKEMVH